MASAERNFGKTSEVGGRELWIDRCHIGGAQLFITDRVGPFPEEQIR